MEKKKKKADFDENIPAEKQSERQKWSYMNREQKMQYIMDYYLVRGIVVIIAISCIVYLIFSFFKPREEKALFVAVIERKLDEEEKKKLKEKMSEKYGIDSDKVQIDDDFYLSNQGQEKLEVYLYNKQIDAIIASKDVFSQYAAFGFFDEIPNILSDSEQQMYKDRYIAAAGYEENDEVSFDDKETGEGEKLPYGILVDDFVFSVTLNAPHKENAVKFLHCLMDE